MLQQTQVATVVGYFNRFMDKFPDVQRLAAADEADVLKLWEGLGYYRRARQLHAAARQIVTKHGGEFPSQFDDVLALPGIGRYTAGAILSISLDQRQPILEGNTIRLFARLLALRTDPRSAANQRELWQYAAEILPLRRVGDFNQALMELGSQLCTPQHPACDCCPLMHRCSTFSQGIQAEVPVSGRRMCYEEISEAVVLIPRRGKYLVRVCQSPERWAGLWDFPRYRIEPATNGNYAADLEQQVAQDFGLSTTLQPIDWYLKHAVTRYRITLHCLIASQVVGRLKSTAANGRWQSVAEIAALPMSVTGRKIARQLLQIVE